jgi:MSHA pilin protein MshD
VNDYHGYSMTGITDVTGTAIAGLGAYTASVTVAGQAIATVPAVPASDSLLITVTVLGPPGSNTKVVLDGYRVRYAPNALP